METVVDQGRPLGEVRVVSARTGACCGAAAGIRPIWTVLPALNLATGYRAPPL